MKKILIIIIVTIITTNLFSQTNYTPTGTWKYINGNDTITVIFKSDQMTVAGATYPILIGFHKYVKNGVIIESTLQHQSSNYIDNNYSIIILNFEVNDVRNDGRIKDITLNYKRAIILTKINPTMMNVRLTSFQDRRPNGTISAYTLPRNFQLIKY